jgi:hypothetical protein
MQGDGDERPGRSRHASEISTGCSPHAASSINLSSLACAARADICQRGIVPIWDCTNAVTSINDVRSRPQIETCHQIANRHIGTCDPSVTNVRLRARQQKVADMPLRSPLRFQATITSTAWSMRWTTYSCLLATQSGYQAETRRKAKKLSFDTHNQARPQAANWADRWSLIRDFTRQTELDEASWGLLLGRREIERDLLAKKRSAPGAVARDKNATELRLQ